MKMIEKEVIFFSFLLIDKKKYLKFFFTFPFFLFFLYMKIMFLLASKKKREGKTMASQIS